MIPVGLLRGTPIDITEVREGDVIDTYNPYREELSRFHHRKGQTVTDVGGGTCDIYTDYDMICRNLDLLIQLVHRPTPTP